MRRGEDGTQNIPSNKAVKEITKNVLKAQNYLQ
jgi:hypothetical protein